MLEPGDRASRPWRQCRSLPISGGSVDVSAILAVRALSKTFGGGRTWIGKPNPSIHAVQDISFNVARGETLGIVGESGCGKSTLARMLVGLLAPTAGNIEIDGKPVSQQKLSPAEFGRMIQYVFQDPISSLNPRKTIRQILEAPLIHLHGLGVPERRARLVELLDAVQLRSEALDRYPHEFSGGQGSAHRHCTSARRRAGHSRPRRASLSPRRICAGADPEPALGSAEHPSISPISSSVTILPSSKRSVTGSPSSISADWSSWHQQKVCLKRQSIPIPNTSCKVRRKEGGP